MDILDSNDMLTELRKLRNELSCQFCNKTCKNPVKVKVCGHYFCKNCLKYRNKDLFTCPKCKICYEERDVDYNNIAKETEGLLSELEQCLVQAINKTEETCNTVQEKTSEGNTTGELTKPKAQEEIPDHNMESHTIKYNNKQYHIKFVEDLCNKINAKGETPLHIACKRKKLKEVTALLNRVDINAQDFAGWAPLHEAVESGSEQVIESLLKHGALIDILGEEYTTPLHKATVSHKINIIKLLLKYGADPEIVDIFGRKPIEYTKDKQVQSILSEELHPRERVEQLYCKKIIVAYCYYVELEYVGKLKKAKIKVLEEYDSKKVTHFVIRKTHKISLKILVAMLDGCTIVPQEWIDDFLKDDPFIPFPTYTFIHISKLNEGMQKAMMNHLLKLPKLFNGINFFISGHKNFVKIHDVKFTKEYITALIRAGGGKSLHRAPALRTCEEVVNFPFHARNSAAKCCNYIIYEENNPPELRYQMAEIKHKSSTWLVECVVNFTILD
ncbi:hypothetical protein JTB14_026389 [Gonioctena quinquepunctata]|nr:hypothetical protein JTB14_026389 [Gonioctena quinquepunctata]